MPGNWIATYRIQLHAGFPLSRAQEVLPYLAGLGISHVYLSPCLQAVPGSLHGYDVADPTRISADLGGEGAWSGFIRRARELGLGVLLDIVPNHMSASWHNPWWDDVLAHGPYSAFAEYFDFRLDEGRAFRIHVCSLARSYGDTLAEGRLKLDVSADVLRVEHYGDRWPLGPASWEALLGHEGAAGCFEELDALRAVPRPGPIERRAYQRCAGEAQTLLADARRSGALERAARRINEDRGALDAVLRRQFYELHGWKLAGELTNYRRFFDVGTLAGLRTELPEVFEATHARIAAMAASGDIDGVRIDHPDGLREPLVYLKRVRALLPKGRIYVEKILESDERLKEDWPIEGTVGYEFLAKVNRLWMDDQRSDVLTATYFDFTGHPVNLAALIREKKRAILESTFSRDHDLLARSALALARREWRTRDISPRQLREALARLVVALPIYRTYRTLNTLAEDDRRVLSDAVQSARIAAPEIDIHTFDFLASLLTKFRLSEAEADFAAQWQQLTPAVMAKGVEDTAFYCFDRLVSCNEVGAEASLIGISAGKFHEFCHGLSERWPNALLATSTHDNKRSEDVRTRISLLSEIPDRWTEALHHWSRITAPAWQNRVPDRHAEYLLYQTLIGAWPIDRERCWQYMLKACREAKINTSWHEPNAAYEESVRGFVEGIFQMPEFMTSLERFVEPLVLPGRINSLAQTLIKMIVPGVPDFYQGTELWDLSLVDPDNRRPVDFELRASFAAQLGSLTAAQVLKDWDSGLPKLWMISRLLKLRRQRPADFTDSSKYQPLVAQGAHLSRLLAFRRGESLIVVVPRLTVGLHGGWGDTRLPLPGGRWRDHFTDAIVEREARPDDLFAGFPVTLLVREAA